MSRDMWFRMCCGAVGVVAVTSAAIGTCWVPATKNCCDLLMDGSGLNLDGWCHDEITSNPSVSHCDVAPLGAPGQTRRLSGPQATCTWDDYYVNAQGNCVKSGGSSSNCDPVTLVNPTCTGTGNP